MVRDITHQGKERRGEERERRGEERRGEERRGEERRMWERREGGGRGKEEGGGKWRGGNVHLAKDSSVVAGKGKTHPSSS